MPKGQGKPLWGGRFRKPPAPELLDFSRSISFDRKLWREELMATRAHAEGLARAGLVSKSELRDLHKALDEAELAFEADEFEFSETDEDIHSALERFLTDRLGEVGAKVHAGRSRNDLVAADLRLWLKRVIPEIARGIYGLQESLVNKSKEHQRTLVPGFTHLQRAQPVMLAHLLLAHAFSLSRDFERMTAAYKRADVSPLGAGAFAGTTLPIDPKGTAEELGFSDLFDNAADAVSDRDFALEFLSAGAILGVHLSRLAEEIVIWTSTEFGFAVLDDSFSTGSSIMPQKKNPDVAELARAKSARLIANLVQLLSVMKGLPLTYNRDLQEDKEPVFDTAETLMLTLPALGGSIETITFDEQRLESAARHGSSGATDLAEALVKKGMPFRRAHELVGEAVARAESQGRQLSDLDGKELHALDGAFDEEMAELLDPVASAGSRASHGGTAPERIIVQLKHISSLMRAQDRWIRERR
ncbi:MAG: argininosuccinate lyase [Acidimicrobiia bacterium]